MEKSLPEIVFLDVAGTLLRMVRPVGYVYAEVAGEYGWRLWGDVVEREFRRVWGGMGEPEYVGEGGEEVDEGWWREVVRRTLAGAGGGEVPEGFPLEECFRRLWDYYGETGAWELFGDVEAALDRLGAVVRLGVISNFDARLWPLLRGHGLLERFEVVVHSSAVGVVKPREGIFHAACRGAGVEPWEALHVGDDPVRDWAGARAAGMGVWELRRPGAGLLEMAADVESGRTRVSR